MKILYKREIKKISYRAKSGCFDADILENKQKPYGVHCMTPLFIKKKNVLIINSTAVKL